LVASESKSAGASSQKRWQSYVEYKDSGVEWLGEIPRHWEVCPLRRKLRDGNDGVKIGPFGSQLKLEFMQETGYKVYGQEHVIADDFTVGSKYVGEQKFAELSACSIQPGDLLVTMMGSSGRCRVVPPGIEPGLMDSHLLRLRVREDELHPHFAALVIDQGAYVNDQLMVAGKGAIMHGLNSSIVKDIVLAVPPLSDQRVITAFLDRETARIDALVGKQERLIALLEEKRAALISHTVTKGLDPTVPMKDSSIPWLGEVPAHWEVVPLKYLTPEITVGIVVTPSKYYIDKGVPCLRSLNVKEGYLTENDLVFISPESNEMLRKSMIFAGDLVSVRSGQPGTTAVIDERFHEANCIDLIITRQSRHFDSFFMAYLLNSYAAKYQFGLGSGGAIQQHFNIETAKSLLALVPPPSEQDAIAAYLDCETARLDALIAKAQEMIERLQEYRTALISAAVTGKIDVRGEV
jgi:type I restriction enzyme S subunit